MSQNEKENLNENLETLSVEETESKSDKKKAEPSDEKKASETDRKIAEPSDNKKATKPKKKISKLLCVGIIAIFAILSFVVGIIVADVPIFDLFSKTKTFTADEFNIVLPKEFTPVTGSDEYLACYSSNDVSIYIKKDVITEDSNLKLYDLDNYRLNLLHENGLLYENLKNTEGNPYFVYDYLNEASGVTYTFYTFAYKTDGAFWMVQFATEKAQASQLEADIIKWADTITFKEQTESK